MKNSCTLSESRACIGGGGYDAALDILKIASIMGVLLLHTILGSPFLYNNKGSTQWFVILVIYSLTRCSVPVFFMVNGILVLRKKIDWKSFYIKQIKRYIPIICFWTLFYYAFLKVGDISSFFKNQILIDMIWEPIALPHLWYLYVLLGIYLLLPAVKVFIDHSTKGEYVWLIWVWIVFAGLDPLFKYFKVDLGLNYGVFPNYTSKFIGFFCLGYYLYYHKTFLDHKIVSITLLFANLCLTVILTFFENSPQLNINNIFLDTFMTFYSFNIVIMSLSFFKIVKGSKFTYVNGNVKRLIKALASNTLGVYLIHEAFLRICRKYIMLQQNTITYILVYFFIAFLCSNIITYVMRKIPICKLLV